MRALITIALATAALAACNPTLTAQTTAPPGRSARLDPVVGFWGTKYYRMEISQGVALAITCHEGSPCEKLRVTSDDSKIAEARAASISRLDPPYANVYGRIDNQQTAAAMVVVGKAPGSTIVRVRSLDGDRDIHVTVIAPPLANPMTAAAKP